MCGNLQLTAEVVTGTLDTFVCTWWAGAGKSIERPMYCMQWGHQRAELYIYCEDTALHPIFSTWNYTLEGNSINSLARVHQWLEIKGFFHWNCSEAHLQQRIISWHLNVRTTECSTMKMKQNDCTHEATSDNLKSCCCLYPAEMEQTCELSCTKILANVKDQWNLYGDL